LVLPAFDLIETRRVIVNGINARGIGGNRVAQRQSLGTAHS
tara:strand:- start:131463 stop:131585 length:123 start_codon:yes stop_codon:yes gene_type:complete